MHKTYRQCVYEQEQEQDDERDDKNDNERASEVLPDDQLARLQRRREPQKRRLRTSVT